MKNKIKVIILLFLVVNSLWAMNRFSPLTGNASSAFRRYVPSSFSAGSNRALSTSGNLSQAYRRIRKENNTDISELLEEARKRRTRGLTLAQKIAYLENKVKQQKEEESASSFVGKLQIYDKKIQKAMKDSLIGSVLTTIGLTLGGRYLYDSYVTNKKAQTEPINQKIETQASEPIKNISSETPKQQEVQSYWTSFSNAIADRWNALTQGVAGSA